MQEHCGRAGRGKRRRHLSTNEPRFSHPRDNDASAARLKNLYGPNEFVSERVVRVLQRLCFERQHTLPARDDFLRTLVRAHHSDSSALRSAT